MGGRLDAYAAAAAERKLDSHISANQCNLVVDLSKLEYISSSGLRILLAALKKVRKQQGDIRLAALQPYVREVFDVAGFSQLFKMYDKQDEAVSSFQAA
jgi:anti-sigma B factor antagonist